MFGFMKNMFCHHDSLEERKAKAVAQDKEVRDSMTNKDYDNNIKASMHNSDPIAKY